MAAVVVTQILNAEDAAPGTRFTYAILFFGAGVRTGGDHDLTQAVLLGTDTALQIRQKISTAIMARAVALGYTLTVTNIFIPDFSRGA